MKEYQEVGKNGELFIWKEGHSFIHDVLLMGEYRVPFLVVDRLDNIDGKCYIEESIPGYTTHH
jgi:hypothetical protein